jgi:hypothetical protein
MKTRTKPAAANAQPVVTRLSETEMVLTYPDGSTTHVTKNRATGAKDGLWLLQMVSTLAPQFEKSQEEAV